MMKKEDIKVGQEVWFKATYADVNSGVVTEIREHVKTPKGEEIHVMLNGTRDTIGSMGARIKDCYPTKEALLDGVKAESDSKIEKYCESIQTVEDLVRFCYDHNMHAEEYTDWEAQKAAQIRAKELLGIDIDRADRNLTNEDGDVRKPCKPCPPGGRLPVLGGLGSGV